MWIRGEMSGELGQLSFVDRTGKILCYLCLYFSLSCWDEL